MINFIKGFLKEEDGMGTVEIILIIAVLVAIALLFRNTIMSFVNGIISKIFPDAGAASYDNNSQPIVKPSPTVK